MCVGVGGTATTRRVPVYACAPRTSSGEHLAHFNLRSALTSARCVAEDDSDASASEADEGSAAGAEK